jgi:hypothetical protein
VVKVQPWYGLRVSVLAIGLGSSSGRGYHLV